MIIFIFYNDYNKAHKKKKSVVMEATNATTLSAIDSPFSYCALKTSP